MRLLYRRHRRRAGGGRKPRGMEGDCWWSDKTRQTSAPDRAAKTQRRIPASRSESHLLVDLKPTDGPKWPDHLADAGMRESSLGFSASSWLEGGGWMAHGRPTADPCRGPSVSGAECRPSGSSTSKPIVSTQAWSFCTTRFVIYGLAYQGRNTEAGEASVLRRYGTLDTLNVHAAGLDTSRKRAHCDLYVQPTSCTLDETLKILDDLHVRSPVDGPTHRLQSVQLTALPGSIAARKLPPSSMPCTSDVDEAPANRRRHWRPVSPPAILKRG